MRELLTPALPFRISLSAESDGINSLALSHICFFEIELFHSCQTRERNCLSIKSFAFGNNGLSKILPTSSPVLWENPLYVLGPETSTAFGPTSLNPLALTIK